MPTSGTIGDTKFSVTQIIEKALRRCGLNPAGCTPETLDTAREDLFLLLMSLSSRGLNLWCIDRQVIDLIAGQATYVLPAGTITVLNVVLSSPQDDGSFRDLPITPLNRDDYYALPNKSQQSAIPVNYWFEKLVSPQLTLWPVPNDSTKKLTLARYRQPQDVGDFQGELEVPLTWTEAIIWQLALRLAYELPEVKPERAKMVEQMAMTMTIESEGGETDSAPVYFAPNISGYTR